METLDEQLDAANARLTEQSEKLAALETEIATLQATNEELSDNLPHHVSRQHVPMSMDDRAAQFSPFAALTGHDAAIAEAARLTDERPILDESVKLEISDRLQAAAAAPSIALNIVYFVPDARKTGGSFSEVCGRIKKLVPHESLIIMEDGTRIKVEDVVEIELGVG